MIEDVGVVEQVLSDSEHRDRVRQGLTEQKDKLGDRGRLQELGTSKHGEQERVGEILKMQIKTAVMVSLMTMTQYWTCF